MKNLFLLLIGTLLLACSTPKYTYNFDYHDYNSGKRKAVAERNTLAANSSETEAIPVIIDEDPLAIDREAVVASAADGGKTEKTITTAMDREAFAKKYSAMSKSEKKEFRKELKNEVKKYLKNKRSTNDGNVSNATQALDYDLKMAIIFGAVAITLSFFGGVNSVFWVLSVISLVIAVVFFVKWIMEQ